MSEFRDYSTDDLMARSIAATQDLDAETEALCWKALAEPDDAETRIRLNDIAHGTSDLAGEDQLVILAACSTEPVRRALLLGELAYLTLSDRTIRTETL